MTIYYFPPNNDSVGVKVITENFIKACARLNICCEVVSQSPDLTCDGMVIPSGILNGVKCIKRNDGNEIVILGDSFSLGYGNKALFYLKVGYFFHLDFLYSIYGYFRYSFLEKKLQRNYKKIVLFSQTDISHLQRKFPNAKCTYICVPNGAYPINNKLVRRQRCNEVLRIGLLSSWNSFQSYEENNWFIRRYFKKFVKKNPNVKLVVAGKGRYINKLKNIPNVEVVGYMADLSVFFNQIDAFIAVNPKGCGILNRVLDAVVYKVPVIGIRPSFSGFPNSDDCFYKFDDYKSFVSCIKDFQNDPGLGADKAIKALKYIEVNNNWQNNYNYLLSEIIKLNRNENKF